MYYPYLRGKRFELNAIKELVNNNSLSNTVIPIIEPVKRNTDELMQLIDLLNSKKKKFVIIQNPEVGDYKGQTIPSNVERNCPIIGELIHRGSDINNLKKASTNKKLAILKGIPNNNVINSLNSLNCLVATDVPKLVTNKSNLILFDDKFKKRKRNSDYLKCSDEPFSQNNKFYKSLNANGFGDYSIVGNNYNTGGRGAFEVSLHIVYFDGNDDIRIHHFTSNTKNGTRNQYNKIQQSLKLFRNWYNSNPNKKRNSSSGAEKLINGIALSNGIASLGRLKQYTIMHHLEIMKWN